MALIRKHGVAANTWQWLDSLDVGKDGSLPELPAGDVLVPAQAWQRAREQLRVHVGRVGVWLRGNDDPGLLVPDFSRLSVIAVHFPKLVDGRGYSIARLLRERYGWRGELRAVGDVQRDELFFLARCGFDSFDLREGEEVDLASAGFRDFSERYQAAVDAPLPLFRRREPSVA